CAHRRLRRERRQARVGRRSEGGPTSDLRCPEIKLPPTGGSEQSQSIRSPVGACHSGHMKALSNARPRFHTRLDLCSCGRSGRIHLVPVENGQNKRGGRLPYFSGYSSVLPLGYKMSWVL